MGIVLNATIIFSAVLIVASLSGLISEKVGIVNIGIEGMMVIGALFFMIFGNIFQGYSYWWTFFLALIMGGLVAGIFALLHGLATIKLKANHVVSGTAINLFGSGLALFLIKTTANKFSNNSVDNSYDQVYENNFIGDDVQTLNLIYLFMALTIGVGIFFYFRNTKIGLRHASIGENPNAADSAAINVNRYKWIVVFASGLLGGIAGAFAATQIGKFNGSVQGLGFLALAIMILGQWRVSLVILTAIVFAFLWSFAYTYVIEGLPSEVMYMLPFILSLITLVILSKYQVAPKAAGLNFDKSKR